MTDRELLEKHINLDNSCLTESEKEKKVKKDRYPWLDDSNER